jgi:hypothetical protein
MLEIASLAASAVSMLVHFISKGGEEAAGEAGKGLVGWIKDKLIGKKKEQQLEALQQAPDNQIQQGKVIGTLEDLLNENPALAAELHKLVEAAKAAPGINVSNSKNVVTGNVSAGGSVIIGDNNTTNK